MLTSQNNLSNVIFQTNAALTLFDFKEQNDLKSMAASVGNVLFVINPISGGIDKSDVISILNEFAVKQNLVHKIFHTTETEGLENLKKEIAAFKPKIIAALGGDGTCNLVAKAIINTEMILAIIPSGSANGLATELAIPKTLEGSLDLILSGEEKLIDTILINNKLCIHMSDIGLNARVIKRFDEEKIRGIYNYAKQFIKELWEAHPARYDIIF